MNIEFNSYGSVVRLVGRAQRRLETNLAFEYPEGPWPPASPGGDAVPSPEPHQWGIHWASHHRLELGYLEAQRPDQRLPE
eukprot:4339446-Amphidinium_carterae.1